LAYCDQSSLAVAAPSVRARLVKDAVEELEKLDLQIYS
jgi:hypothetical protein